MHALFTVTLFKLYCIRRNAFISDVTLRDSSGCGPRLQQRHEGMTFEKTAARGAYSNCRSNGLSRYWAAANSLAIALTVEEAVARMLHEAAVSEHLVRAEGCVQLSQFLRAQLHVGRAEVLEDAT